MIYFIHNNDVNPAVTDMLDNLLNDPLNDEDQHISAYTLEGHGSGNLYEIGDVGDYTGAELLRYRVPIDGAVGLRLEGNDYDDDDDDDDDSDDPGFDPMYVTPVELPAPPDSLPVVSPVVQAEPDESDEPSEPDQPATPRFTVRQHIWQGYTSDGGSNYPEFKATFQDFARQMQRPVTVDVPHGVRSTLHADGRFWINIWSTPSPTAGRAGEAPATLLGHKVDCRDEPFLPVPEDSPELIASLASMDDGYTIAQLFDSDLFIYHDIVHWGFSTEVALLKDILAWASRVYGLTPRERDARIQLRQQEIAQRARNSYISWVSGRHQLLLSDLERKLDRATIGARQARIEYVQLIRRQEEFTEQLANVRQVEINLDRYGKEFDKLEGHPKIAKITFDHATGAFVIDTTTLYVVDDDGDERELGEFRITVTDDGDINFHNLTRLVDGYRDRMHAPHVFNNGEACLGNFGDIAAPLIAQREYGTLFTMAIAFLETANENDAAGRYVRRWPLRSTVESHTSEVGT